MFNTNSYAMQMTETARETQHQSKTKLLDAALRVIRAKGYSATRIEDICEAAGLTKGSFFHHFKSKEELALAAAEHFSSSTSGVFAAAPYRSLSDPLERLLGYVDFRKTILRGDLPDYTCLLGTMVQEAYDTHPEIRKVCDSHICAHAATLVPDIEAAIRKYGIQPSWTAESLAYHMQAVIQGAFILAKARQSVHVASACMDHLRRYVRSLFLYSSTTKERS
jgi:TetR/AcrR family transcriptional regulator, transcriptional repressor for nem operon